MVRTEEGCIYREQIQLSYTLCVEVCDNGLDGAITVELVTCDSTISKKILIGGQVGRISYTYSIEEGEGFQDSPDFMALIGGSYIVIVRTKSGCEFQEEVIIATPLCVEVCDNGLDNDGDGLTDCEDPDCGLNKEQFSFETILPTCSDKNDGTIIVVNTRSIDSFQYSIDNGETFQ